MNLQLHRPICFFDIEATGTNLVKDRIVELSIIKVYREEVQEEKSWQLNPEYPISKEAQSIHGITNKDVADKPVFKDIAPQICKIIEGSDLAGYNSNRFDIPLLAEELLRAGYPFEGEKHKNIDVQVIFHKMEPRTLSAAYKYYCNKDLKNAHNASADARATYEILEAQLEKYTELDRDVKRLSEFSCQKNTADLAGFIGFNQEGEEMFTFGKHKGQKVLEVFRKDPYYYHWLQKSDFPLYTKKIFTILKLKNLKV